MAATTMTNLTTANRTMWETGVLAVADGMLVADKFCKTKVIGMRAGGTYVVNRLLKVAPVTSAATFGTVVAGTSAKNLVSNKIEVNPELWQDHFGFDDDVDIKAFFTDADYQKRIGQQMANSLDKELIKTLSTQCMRHRIDADGTYQKAGTVGASGSATVFHDAALTEADAFWDGAYVTITNADGPNYDITSQLSTWVAATDSGTVSFPQALTTGSKYRITASEGLVATDVLTSDGLIAVAGLHRKLETEKFPGGVLHGFIDAAQEADLWKDTDFINNANYDASQRYANYRLVRWLDMELLVSSNIYRTDDEDAASATGVVYVAPIFGADSYCLIKWGTPGAGNYGVKFFYVLEPDTANLTLNERYVSWKTSIGKKVLRATSVIGLTTGATDLVLNV